MQTRTFVTEQCQTQEIKYHTVEAVILHVYFAIVQWCNEGFLVPEGRRNEVRPPESCHMGLMPTVVSHKIFSVRLFCAPRLLHPEATAPAPISYDSTIVAIVPGEPNCKTKREKVKIFNKNSSDMSNVGQQFQIQNR